VFEFGAAAVREKGDGLLGVGDPGGFPVGRGGCGPAGVFRAQGWGCSGGQNAEVLGEPGFRAGGQPVPEGPRPLVEPGSQHVGNRWGAVWGALGPGDLVTRQVGQGELLQAVVQDGRDGPGPVQGASGDLADEGSEVVTGELGCAELLLEDSAGVLAVVTPRLMVGEVGFDLLVNIGGQSLADGGGPQGEQVAGAAGPVLSLTDLLAGGQITVVALEDVTEDGFGGGPLVGLAAGWGTNAARVLAHEGLAESYNIAAFLGKIEGSDQLRRPIPLHRDDVLVLDEASQLDTAGLALITEAARQAGARIIATGDTAQLGAVGAGGMLPLLAREVPTAELHEVRRFTAAWERKASVQTRWC
jgi:hypothetical protein